MADGATHKLWGGRFAGGPSAILDAVNRSITVDFRLWPFDIQLSRAWAKGLVSGGVLTPDEGARMDAGLAAVADDFAAGAQPLPSDEDVHTMIDRLLHGHVGDVASKLHTGRSRNDQVATASRLWTMDAIGQLDLGIREVQQVLLKHAGLHQHDLLPAYTHLQRAQPVTLAHWLLSHFWPLSRDRQRLADAARTASVMPLGSGAIAGTAFPVPRALLQQELGFAALSQNSIDAVGDRDFVADTLYALTMTATHLSRLAEDLILFGSSEFGFVQFGDAFSTGSSMMPQKRNPDALELTRGSAARVFSDLTSMVMSLKGLPSGYNKDLQDDKRALFDAVDVMSLVLPAVAGAVDELTFRTDRMRAAVTSVMMATDLADYLVLRGVTFRESHSAVGSLVRQAEERRMELHELPLSAFKAAHATFGDDVLDALGAQASVDRRSVPGGTAVSAVAEQLMAATASLS
ncbi:MAG TPA: argininosuccinate lyase [Gemmatimonadaceae bacterium]|nr:argininosuccinate lyase [Gemmatimonadaceae bacterium]